MLQLRPKDIHFAAIREDDFVIEIIEGFLCLVDVLVFNECLPYFGLFEDEDLDYGAIGAEELVEIIMSDDVTELIIDAD